MNQQNMMQQFFEHQQGSVNGFPGAGFQANQQLPVSFGNGPTSGTNPYMGNSNIRQQNGLASRYGMNESENFDMQSPNTQAFPNFMDPRMSGYDPRSRPNFDPNGMMPPGMDSYGNNSGFSSKMRMNEMAAMFNNPAALAAMQCQRMSSMFTQGRDNDFMSPTNPFGGFNPQQAAQFMQQQRMAAAYQRQVQEQLAAQQAGGGNRTAENRSGGPLTADVNGPSTDKQNTHQNNFPGGNFSQQRQGSSVAGSDVSNQDTLSPQVSGAASTPPVNSNSNQTVDSQNKFPPNESSSSVPRSTYEGSNDTQRNAAMVAAAAVRAAAAATSTRIRSGFPTPNSGGMNNYPFGPQGYPVNNEQMPSPFPTQNIQSPDFNVMSPNKDISMNMMNAASPMNQGHPTSRTGNPPPYSPMQHNTDSNHSASGSLKGSMSNLSNVSKHTEGSQQNVVALQTKEEPNNMRNFTSPTTNENASDGSHGNNLDRGSLMVAGSATKLSAPPTPLSVSAASPAPSFQDDSSDITNLSPSWPQTPLSPNAQKVLKARASPKQYEQLSKVYDLIDDAEKKTFLERYLAFMSVNGTPVTKLPIVGKKPLDLYTLFRSVCERGGIQEVMEKRRFREILACLNLPSGNSGLAYLVKSQYMKYLHAYEIKAKDTLVNQWKNSMPTSNTKISSDVPTIALNDSLTPSMNDLKQNTNLNQVNNIFQMNSSSSAPPNWMPNSMANSSIANSTSTDSSGQYGPRMPYSSQANPGLPTYGQGMPGFGGGQDMPPGYPGYTGYQNAMFPRGPPMQNYNSMRPGMPNDTMPGAWPRGFSPRQSPPELFPEGLQRMPYNHGSQRHPMSAFGTPSYPGAGKSRGQMPPISRDQMQQMKFNAHQQQLKLQQYQQQQQQQRFSTPDSVKAMNKGNNRTHPPEVKPSLTPTHSLKRELAFPPDCVESTKPILKKRKKLTSKDLGPVEAWRIMMSLKSGLVAECTWAIDTLNILLADNNTITYFHLNQLPGLLDTLMDHYRRCLANLFNTFTDLEIPLLAESSDESKPVDDRITDLWVGVCRNAKGSHTSNIATAAVTATMKESLKGGKEFWDHGGGDCTSHIRTSFPNKDIKLKSYPKGLPYVTKADEEKQCKLAEREASCLLSDKDVSPNQMDRKPIPSPTKMNTMSPNRFKKDNSDVSDERSEKPACMGVLHDLMNEFEEEESSKDTKQNPLVDKLLKVLEFSVPYDRKYLEDSKDFIEYLNRRLHRENRGNVQSEQCILKQNTPFVGIPESEQSLLSRCVSLSNIFRSLSFIQGNDAELAGHVGLLLVCGHILLHKHEHAVTDHSRFKLGLDERIIVNDAIAEDLSSNLWESVYAIRENTLVMLANIGGHLNFSRIKDNVSRPLIDGLLHWLVCRSSEALDPLPTAPGNHALSAQRLAMEILAKMTINTSNIDIVVSCPPVARLNNISEVLVKQVARKYPVPTREFAIILLDNLAHSEQFAKELALRRSSISNLVKFVYEAEKNTSTYLAQGGRVQPGLNAEDICGTSISLLRRSVNILLSISKVPCNRRTLIPYTDDILALSTSQMIDTSVLALLAQVLFELTL